MSIYGFKGRIAVEPPVQIGITTEVKGNFAQAKQKVSLLALTVVFGAGDIYAGDTVYVSPDILRTWGSKALEVEGKKFVICPESDIVLVKKLPIPPPPRPEPTSAPSLTDDLHRQFDH